jgi:glycosyltransferase involved in cell wall biosynthesis
VDIRSIRAGIQPANRNEFGYDDNHVVLIYVGRLGPEKNIPFLLRSVAGASQAYENIRLLIVGDGPEKQELMELVNQLNISSVVHFTGMVPYEKVHCYLSMADIFVTASVTEVHPLSVIEAMAVGLPVVGIHSPGISDSIEDGVTGYLVREEDLAAYTAKLVKLISQPEQRRVMGKNAQAAAENFAIENTCERMIELYQMVIQKKAMKRMSFSVRVRRLFDSLGSLK